MKKIISVVLTLTLLAGILMLSGCSLKTEKLDTAALLGNYNIEELKGTEINVYNWGEYISDGEGGSVDVISEFEKLTGIKVNYNMYDSNEDLYAKLKSGGVNYDVIIPSDYMAERLKNEGLLQKLDYSVITNYEGIGDEYKNLFFDENNEYTVAYTGGMVGLIYNTTMVSEKPDSWSAMWDPKYSGEILTFNNSRDAFGVAQYLLGYDVNSTNPDEWRAAEEKLKEQKPQEGQAALTKDSFGHIFSCVWKRLCGAERPTFVPFVWVPRFWREMPPLPDGVKLNYGGGQE